MPKHILHLCLRIAISGLIIAGLSAWLKVNLYQFLFISLIVSGLAVAPDLFDGAMQQKVESAVSFLVMVVMILAFCAGMIFVFVNLYSGLNAGA